MKIELERAYQAPYDTVKQRLTALEGRLHAKYHLTTEWVDPATLSLGGHGVHGRIALDEHMLRVDLDLSAVLMPLRHRIEKELGKELDSVLAA